MDARIVAADSPGITAEQRGQLMTRIERRLKRWQRLRFLTINFALANMMDHVHPCPDMILVTGLQIEFLSQFVAIMQNILLVNIRVYLGVAADIVGMI